MALNFNNIQIDEELERLLPPLSKEDYNILEQSLLKNGFEQKFGRIKVWFPKGNNGKCYQILLVQNLHLLILCLDFYIF